MDFSEIVALIEDKAALEYGLRVIMEAAERKAMPEDVFLPTFNDPMLDETFTKTLELVVGK